jgi:hypothetical protein
MLINRQNQNGVTNMQFEHPAAASIHQEATNAIAANHIGDEIDSARHARGETSALVQIDELPYYATGQATNVVLDKEQDIVLVQEPTHFGAEEDPVLKGPEKGMSVEELTKFESEIAAKLLEQNGWEILAELARNAAEQIGVTKCYVLPIIYAMDDVLAKLGEHAEQFEQAFAELRGNIDQAAQALLTLTKQHQDKRGVPQAEDYEVVAILADGYNNLLHQFDTSVGTMMLKQMEDLEQFGINGEYLFEVYQKVEAAAAAENEAVPAK